MKKLLASLVFANLLALPLLAQDAPKFELFGGYQFLHAGSFDGEGASGNANGWDGAAKIGLSQHVGVTADFSGNYATYSGGGGSPAPVRIYTVAFGPVVSSNSSGRLNPFVHALFGYAHLRPNGCALFSGSPDECGSGSEQGFAMMLGGGFDVRTTRRISIRVMQFDWIRLPSDFGATNNNLRFSAGAVFRF